MRLEVQNDCQNMSNVHKSTIHTDNLTDTLNVLNAKSMKWEGF